MRSHGWQQIRIVPDAFGEEFSLNAGGVAGQQIYPVPDGDAAELESCHILHRLFDGQCALTPAGENDAELGFPFAGEGIPSNSDARAGAYFNMNRARGGIAMPIVNPYTRVAADEKISCFPGGAGIPQSQRKRRLLDVQPTTGPDSNVEHIGAIAWRKAAHGSRLPSRHA